MAQQAQVAVTVPANGSVNDVLQGQTLRFIRNQGIVQMGIVAANGATIGNILANVTIGGRAVAQNYACGVEASAGDGVLEDRDVKIKANVIGGDEVLVNLTNTTAGAIVVYVYVNVPFQG